MSRKKIVQRLAIVLLGIAVIFLIPNTSWNERTSVVGFISLLCGTLGSLISIFIPTNYTYSFCKSDWIKESNDFSLFIAANKHGLGNSPQVKTFSRNNDTFEEVGVYIHHDENGNITIGATDTFDGKVIIS